MRRPILPWRADRARGIRLAASAIALAVMATAALAVASLWTACDDEAIEGGGPGASCYFDSDCAPGYGCAQNLPSSPFPVCSGVVPEGGACTTKSPCLYELDERGLPLACESGTCQFPATAGPPGGADAG